MLANRISKLLLIACFALTFSSAPSQAHPHSWIEIKTHILGSESAITGFKMEWRFDAMTSAYMLEGENLSEKNQASALKAAKEELLTNLVYEHYFTYFYINDEPIRYHAVSDAELTMQGLKMVLSFELPLARPFPIQKSGLKLLIFEPSYFVDMFWSQAGDVTLDEALAKHCTAKIIEPTPTAEQMQYALSLPADADPDNTLGQLFTQKALLECNVEDSSGDSID